MLIDKKLRSLVDVITDLGSSNSTQGLTFINGENKENFMSYTELYSEARGILFYLQKLGIKKGDEVVFQIEDNHQFIKVFWACLLGGIIPVPITVSSTNEHKQKFFKIWGILNKSWLITDEKIISSIQKFAEDNDLDTLMEDIKLKTILLNEMTENYGNGEIYNANEDDIAFIQFSSGSTGDPKGVILTHKNLMTNIEAIISSGGVNEKDSVLSWMPLTHDMGLIGGHLVPVRMNIHQYSMPTSLFARNPALWIEKVNQKRVTILSSPNFGYHFLLKYLDRKKTSGREIGSEWDLSCVRLIFNGAEPISSKVCNDFLEGMEQFGLKRNVMFPVYGMAEASLAITFPPPQEEMISLFLDRKSLNTGEKVTILEEQGIDNTVNFVDLGSPVDNCEVRICGIENNILGDMEIGSIHIKGDNVTSGYYNNKEATEKAFTEDGWLITGDLGFTRDGRLIVTGRQKDIIFVNGQNYYPHDIERVVSMMPDSVALDSAAFSVFNEETQQEDIMLAVIFRKSIKDFIPLENKLKKYINLTMGLNIINIIPVKKIPKTTSGKVQRYKFADKYISGEFDSTLLEIQQLAQAYEVQRTIIAPTTDTEKSILTLFQYALGKNKIDILDNFFEMGGDSIRAATLVSMIQKEFGAEVQISDIFKNPSIKALASWLETKAQGVYTEIEKVEEKDYYELSSSQKRLYILNQMEDTGISYNLPRALKIKGKLDFERLENVFATLVQRHEVFRTSFELVDGVPVQRIHPNIKLEISRINQSNKDLDSIIKDFVKPFDLSHVPLIRVGLLESSEDKHVMIFDIHHIIFDGTSMGNLMKEFVSLYNGVELSPLLIQYKDFSAWQNKLLTGERMIEAEKYWLKQFDKGVPTLNLPTDYSRPVVRSFDGDSIRFSLERELTDQLKKAAMQEGVTLFMILLAAFNVLLSKYSGQNDIVVGTPVTGRGHADLDSMMGMFVNTLALRNEPAGEKKFKHFLNEVKESSINAYKYQDYQFEELVGKLAIPQDFSRNPIFDVVFVLQNMELEEMELGELNFTPYNFKTGTSKFDITLTATENDDTLDFELEYSTELFQSNRMTTLIGHYINVLKEVIENVEIKISEIEILSEEDKQTLLYTFNNTESSYPIDKCIHELIEDKAKENPNHLAVFFEGTSLSYQDINERSQQLATVIKTRGIGSGDIVGIMVEPSVDMIVGILGILKAGAAFLPIDPAYPTERIKFMLQDSRAALLLSQSTIYEKAQFDGEVICDIMSIKFDIQNEKILNKVKSSDLAYVIYTSGTTGLPKGVMVEHRSLVNLTQWHCKNFNITENDKASKYAGFAFDASVWEIFPYLVQGASLYIVPSEIRFDPDALNKYFQMNGITVSFLPTQICEQFLQLENNSLRFLLTGGDKLKSYQPQSYQLVNCYGPTENTVVTTYHNVSEWTGNISIGKPVSNTQVYIVDENHRIQPIGVAGEICVSGDSLARGYLNRPELTAEKFVPNPFIAGTRMYKTGDLARWRADGTIEYLGRLDQQIKIRGHRIEIGEVEKALLKHEYIVDMAITTYQDHENQKYLVAYIVLDTELSTNHIRNFLGETLPDYMIPSAFIQIEKIPLNQNGKIDWKVLPTPEFSTKNSSEFKAPVTQTDKRLAKLWQNILGVSEVGLNDNFFELGGHSLKVATLASQIHKEFGVNMPIGDLFKAKTLQEQSTLLETAKRDLYSGIKKVKEAEYYKASSAQQRLFVLSQLEDSGINYNMPQVLEVVGTLDLEKLKWAFQELVNRHESLRTSFELRNGEVMQKIDKESNLVINLQEVSEDELESTINSSIIPFDLSLAPLIRVNLLKLSNEKILLLFDMHHIISDGVSISILIREFISLYSGEVLPELPIQYKDFSAWQQTLLNDEVMKKQEAYWLDQYSDEVPVLDLHTDYQRPSMFSYEGDSIKFSLDPELTSKLKNLAIGEGATLYMALLASFNLMLHKYSGKEDIVIGSPVAGRNHSDLDNVIGMFVNTLALRNKPESQKTFKSFISEVKNNALAAFENQDYPLESLVEKLNLKRDLSRNPIFDYMFVLQNVDKRTVKTDDFSLIPREFGSKVAKFDITLFAEENNDQIDFELEYCTKLFSKQTMEYFSKYFIQIITSVTANPDVKLSEISMMTEVEKRQIIFDFNDTKTDYPKEKTISELFEEQVEKNANKIALVYGEEQLTYKELNERANNLAWILKGKGVGPDCPVGIMDVNSTQMMIGLLAILKSGGAYVLIDPAYPADRINFLLEDSGIDILLASKDLASKFDLKQEIIDVGESSLQLNNINNPERVNKPNDLAYIIYTSGSTGKPKGVLIEHVNVIRLVRNTNYIKFNEKDRFIQIGAVVFDASTFEFWGPLLNGASLYLVEKEKIVDAQEFSQVLKQYEITSMFITAALFNQMVTIQPEMFSGVKNLLVGGEALSPKHINLVRNQCKEIVVSNGYGPTENTTFSICHKIEKDYDSNIPIGKPIFNSTAYIVDRNGNLQPIGVPGELWVGGDGVARGYLNRPELTSEKFINSTFIEGERIYKTGDLARWLPDGSIEYLGRIDQQVKIRGFRIEVGEVESVILEIDYVKEAVVIAREDDIHGKYLAAYIVSDEKLIESNIKELLAKELPNYMIPTVMVQVEKIPLTHNGKVKKDELLNMEGQTINGNEYVAPSNPTEEKLVKIWKDILGLKNIGVTDNFFDIGGHSLNATALVSRIQKECNANIALKEVFTSPSIRELAVLIDRSEKQLYLEIKPVSQMDIYEVGYYLTSAAQRRMYLLFNMDPSAITYNIPVAMVVKGKLDIQRMQKVFNELINRHESLRTSFKMIDGEILQQIHENVELTINYKENDRDNQNDYEKIDSAIKNFVVPFDLNIAPLFRVEILKIADDKHVMLFDIHHIVADGVSMDILTKEFARLYAGQELEPLQIQYKDFAAWQNSLLESGVTSNQEKYWKDLFSDEIPVLNMPTTYPRPLKRNFKGETLNFTLEGRLIEELNTIASKTGTTMYMVLLAAINVTLSKYTGQEDIIIGSPVAGRRHADLQNMIGMFVNTLSMRNKPVGNKPFMDFLFEVKENTLNAYENQDYQFEELVANLDIPRDLSRNPLFDFMFSLHSFGENVFESGGLKFSNHEMENKISKFDLSLDAVHDEKRIKFSVEYATDLYSSEAINTFIRHFTNTLEQIALNPNLRLSEIDMLSPNEKNNILYNFNATKYKYEKNKTLHQLFEERVEKQPNYPAIHFEGVTITYSELNKKVNQLARYLREIGVQREELVPIMCERSIDMIVGILSVLKAGGAYLPIDPYYPVDRINFMLEDSKAKILITRSDFEEKGSFKGQTLKLDDHFLFEGDDQNLTYVNQPGDLAYVIYTSGSTGKPKGVMIEHKSVINLATWLSGMLSLENKKFLHMSNVSFDNSVEEIFPQLISGATIYILSKESSLDRRIFTDFIQKNEINIVNLLPITMKELLVGQEKIKCLQHVMVGGEKLEESLKDQILSKGYTLTDHYGPTESTVDAIFTHCVKDKTVIGKPISNTRVYIVDSYNNPVAIGVVGEICIAGDGLARGYLNRPELTDEKFVLNPFEENQKMYRTGDLGYWNNDGEIVYLGRADNQIKIRGFRIELGEIEKQLSAHDLISDVIVIDRMDKQGNKYLCGYFVAEREFTTTELKGYLLRELPEYMVPTRFVQLERLPQTPNGKVDKKSLPEPEFAYFTDYEYVPPGDELESKIVSIWSKVLSVEEDKISINESFFDLGGNSISVMQMMNLINDSFESQVVRVTDLFNYTTVQEISNHINSQLNIVEENEQEEIMKFTL